MTARERRDGDERYGGKRVAEAIAAFHAEIGPDLVGRVALDQGWCQYRASRARRNPTLARLGANAVLAASLAKALAAAGSVGTPLWRALSAHLPLLPLPMVR